MEIVVRSLSRAVRCGDGRASRSNARAARATAGRRCSRVRSGAHDHTGSAGAVTSWQEDKLDVDGVPRIASPSCPKRRDRDGVGLQVLDVREQASGILGTELERRGQNRPWAVFRVSLARHIAAPDGPDIVYILPPRRVRAMKLADQTPRPSGRRSPPPRALRPPGAGAQSGPAGVGLAAAR